MLNRMNYKYLFYIVLFVAPLLVGTISMRLDGPSCALVNDEGRVEYRSNEQCAGEVQQAAHARSWTPSS